MATSGRARSRPREDSLRRLSELARHRSRVVLIEKLSSSETHPLDPPRWRADLGADLPGAVGSDRVDPLFLTRIGHFVIGPNTGEEERIGQLRFGRYLRHLREDVLAVAGVRLPA